jgi:hypothetical protein
LPLQHTTTVTVPQVHNFMKSEAFLSYLRMSFF